MFDQTMSREMNDYVHQPALLIRHGTFEIPRVGVWRSLSSGKNLIEKAIPAVGRIDSGDPAVPYLGTCFLIAENLVVTARHVAEGFVSGVGDRDLRITREVDIDFLREFGSKSELRCKVTRARLVHQHHDVAVLEIERVTPKLPPLMLVGHDTIQVEKDVVVIGYPAFDPRDSGAAVTRDFDGIYEVKRLMPGKTRGMSTYRPFGREVPALTHDARVLNGTAGAPVVDTLSGQVVGIQSFCHDRELSYAVPVWELSDQECLVQVNSSFSTLLETISLQSATLIVGDNDGSESVTETESGSSERRFEGVFEDYEKITKIHDLFSRMGLASEGTIKALFNGMPPEFVAGLTPGPAPSVTLLNHLSDINRVEKKFSGHTPLYIVLKTAIALQPLHQYTPELELLLLEVEKVEATLTKDR